MRIWLSELMCAIAVTVTGCGSTGDAAQGPPVRLQVISLVPDLAQAELLVDGQHVAVTGTTSGQLAYKQVSQEIRLNAGRREISLVADGKVLARTRPTLLARRHVLIEFYGTSLGQAGITPIVLQSNERPSGEQAGVRVTNAAANSGLLSASLRNAQGGTYELARDLAYGHVAGGSKPGEALLVPKGSYELLMKWQEGWKVMGTFELYGGRVHSFALAGTAHSAGLAAWSGS